MLIKNWFMIDNWELELQLGLQRNQEMYHFFVFLILISYNIKIKNDKSNLNQCSGRTLHFLFSFIFALRP